MTDIFDVANSAHAELERLKLPHVFIGGVALQAWGEPRLTRDVDISVWAPFGEEEPIVSQLLEAFRSRIAGALPFAIQNRVLLCETEDGIGIDIGLAAFPFEKLALERAHLIELVKGCPLPCVSAEDLVVMKVFAGRPRDWEDVKSIIERQGSRLQWDVIDDSLPELLEAIGFPERFDQLAGLR